MYSVFLNGNRICPECSAMMSIFHGEKDLILKCMDCNKRFIITGQKEIEKEMVLEEVKK
jgi:DNA-directed RNA polymerase subunit M/transcription elongation factor TFIIS